MRDVTQGRLLIMVSVVTAIAYFWALFLSPEDPSFLGRTIQEWALIIPIMIYNCPIRSLPHTVIPAKVGIHDEKKIDSRFRGNDNSVFSFHVSTQFCRQ